MKVKEISVGFTYTKNLGNYESLKIDAGVVVSVEDGDTTDEVYSRAWNTVKKQISNGIEKHQGGK
ncbi:hypothetical protein [Paenibacillus sp. Marseille-Q4541]|uniref:hypothetical protein n=1 Tax=Paenibacillus sp. Marseille-Q4541 TaxID=2831522 RepID=UPI001BA8DC7C|nr:hypothetical protein [Paenibacillus sp. Marseille-Q4541]